MAGLKENILRYRKEIIFAVILFIVSTTSFALGYLVARDKKAPIVIEQCSTELPPAE